MINPKSTCQMLRPQVLRCGFRVVASFHLPFVVLFRFMARYKIVYLNWFYWILFYSYQYGLDIFGTKNYYW